MRKSTAVASDIKKKNPPGWHLQSTHFADRPSWRAWSGRSSDHWRGSICPAAFEKQANKLCFEFAVCVAGGLLSFVYLDNYLGF